MTIKETTEDRPTSTSSSYAGYQKSYKKWCAKNGCADNDLVKGTKLLLFGCADNDLVTGPKLLLFLREEVIDRKSQTHDSAIRGSSVYCTVNAIVDLYNLQVKLGMNNTPHPRTQVSPINEWV